MPVLGTWRAIKTEEKALVSREENRNLRKNGEEFGVISVNRIRASKPPGLRPVILLADVFVVKSFVRGFTMNRAKRAPTFGCHPFCLQDRVSLEIEKN
jgi:hypothetical protein